MNDAQKEEALALRNRLVEELKPLKNSVLMDLMKDMMNAKKELEVAIVVGGMKTQARREFLKGEIETYRYLINLIETIEAEDLQKPKK